MNILVEISPDSCRLCLEKDGTMESIFSSPDLVNKIEDFTLIKVWNYKNNLFNELMWDLFLFTH